MGAKFDHAYECLQLVRFEGLGMDSEDCNLKKVIVIVESTGCYTYDRGCSMQSHKVYLSYL